MSQRVVTRNLKLEAAFQISTEAHLANYVALTSRKKPPTRQVEACGKVLLMTLKNVGDDLGSVDAARSPLLATMQQERAKSGESWEALVHRFFLTHRWKK